MNGPSDSPGRVSLWRLNKDLVAALIRNTVETYPPEWRLIHEPLQNAIDSFLNPDGSIYDMGGRSREIELELAIGANEIVVRDNGRGISPDRFVNFFYLGSGTKGGLAPELRRLLKGSQGVGIKSTVFTSRTFAIRTVHSGSEWRAELQGFHDFSGTGFPDSIQQPVPTSTTAHSGTELRFQLVDYSVSDFLKDRASEFLSLAGLDNATVDASGRIVDKDGHPHGPFDWTKVLTYYFRKYSYVGCVSRLLGQPGLPPIEFKLRVTCEPTAPTPPQVAGMKPISSGTALSGTTPVAYIDFKQVVNELPQRERPSVVSDYRTLLEAGKQFETLTVFSAILTKADVVALLGRVRKRKASDPTSPSGAPNILVEEPDALVRNATALDRVNGAVLFIASRIFLKDKLAHKSSFSLSVNGLPTDLALEITGAELGYLPSVHLILDVNEPLGYGKRNLPPRSKGLYNQLGRDLWKTLHQLAALLVAQQEERDLSLVGVPFDKTKELGTIPRTDPPLLERQRSFLGRLSAPQTEEDVIASYFHMAARGLVPEYQVVRLSDHTIYDGLFTLPGADGTRLTERDLLTVEFKRSTADLCEADLVRRQNFEDIQLAIVWEATPDSDLPATYVCVTRETDLGFRDYRDGANYRLKHGRHSVQVLALKDVYDAIV